MKKVIRLALLLVMLFGIVHLAGCSGSLSSISIDTVMTVDRSFDGSRVMTAEIPASIYRNAFGSSLDKVNEIISKYAPESMYCTASQNSLGGAVIEIHLDFASLSEYQKEVSDICSGNKSDTAITPSVTFDYSKSALKNGYTLDENFTSLDLLYWLSDAVVTEYPSISSDDASGIFVSGTLQLNLNGENIDLNGSDRIQVSDIESHAFDSINIESTINSDNTIDGNIRYVVSSKVVEELGDRLDNLMKDLVPKNGTLTSNDSDSGGRTYRIKFTSSGADTYVTAMNKALATNDTVFSVSTEGEENSLAVKDTCRMYFNGGYFLDYNDPDTAFTCVLRVPSSYSLESCSGTYGYVDGYDSTYSSNVCEITVELAQPDEVTAVLGYIVDIDSISVSTYVHSEIRVDRSIVFKLSTEADSLIGDSVKALLDSVNDKWSDETSVDREELISSVEYSLSMKASSFDELTQMTRAVLQENSGDDADSNGDGQPENSSLSGGTIAPRQPIYKHYQLTDIINFSKFLKGSRVTEGIQYKLTYPKYYKASFNGNTSFENAASDGQTITCSSYNQIISVSSSAVKINIEGICVLAAWIASLAVCVVFIFFEFTHILVFVRDKKLDVDGAAIFRGRNMFKLTLFAAALACFVIMTVRMIFCIY